MTSHVVVGGCGFLGRHIVRALAERGDEVSVVDVVDFPMGSLAPKTTMLDVSRASASEFDTLIGAAEVIHHYAWTTIPSTSNDDPLADLQARGGCPSRSARRTFLGFRFSGSSPLLEGTIGQKSSILQPAKTVSKALTPDTLVESLSRFRVHDTRSPWKQCHEKSSG